MIKKTNQYNNNSKKGFTFVEILIVFGLIALLGLMIAPFNANYYERIFFEENTSRLFQNIKNAQFRAISSKGGSDWGVKIKPEDYDCESCYVIFRGSSYNDRNDEFDQIFELPTEFELEGVKEIVFERGTGTPIIN